MGGRRTRLAARLAGASALLVLVAVSAASAAGPGSGYRAKAGQLEVQAQQLDNKAHRALLDLYALDTRLARARGRLVVLEARSHRLQAAQAVLGARLSTTRRTLAVSRRALAQHLRNLYEQGGADPIAVVLGSTSLDDAISNLDSLQRVADERRRVVAATSIAENRLARLRAAYAARRRVLDASLAAANGSERRLTAARNERASFVSSLRSQARLKSAQVAALQAAARRAELKSQEIQSSAGSGETAATAPAVDTAPAGTVPAAAETTGSAPGSPPSDPGGRTIVVAATGYSLGGSTATGMPVGWGVVAVDPAVIPLGTRLTIPGYGEGVAADTGSGVHGDMIDLWFPTLAQARAWGRRTVTITLH